MGGAIRFASAFEAKVYKEIRILGLEVFCQTKFPLVKPDDLGRYKKNLEWKIDFVVHQQGKQLYIPVEAKGSWITHNHGAKEAFCKTLRMLESASPNAAKNLIVVSPSQAIKLDELHTTVPFRDLRKLLTEKFNLT